MVRQTNSQDEKGFAALIIAITLVIVTSLIVVGFAQLARNEQNQVTNRQLSNQAYYAAEAGVNDAAAALKAGYNVAKTTCGPQASGSSVPGAKYLANNNVDQTAPTNATPGPTQWTCLLIDPAPTTVEYGSVSTTTPTVFTFSGVKQTGGGYTGTAVSSLTVSWQDADPNVTNYRTVDGATNSSFPPAGASWGAAGMLRLSLTPISALDRDALRNATYTAFLYPSILPQPAGSGVYDVSPSSNGPIINGGCRPGAVPHACTVTITIPPVIGSNGGPFLVSLRSIYSKTTVSIALNGGNGDRIMGAQSKVDSTGRAQDVLKRIQVRIPTHNQYAYPGFDVETTGDICKQLAVSPNRSTDTCDATQYP